MQGPRNLVQRIREGWVGGGLIGNVPPSVLVSSSFNHPRRTTGWCEWDYRDPPTPVLHAHPSSVQQQQQVIGSCSVELEAWHEASPWNGVQPEGVADHSPVCVLFMLAFVFIFFLHVNSAAPPSCFWLTFWTHLLPLWKEFVCFSAWLN